MKASTILLTLVVVAVGLLLLTSADQPISPEAQIARQWYDALCGGDLNRLSQLAWLGSLDKGAFRQIAASYAASCDALIDRGMIGFEWIPPELSQTVTRVRFVAANLSRNGGAPERNHILSIRNGVHVVFFRSGAIRVLPDWLGQPLTPVAAPSDTLPLHNNDGLFMGSARVEGSAAVFQSENTWFVGLPVALSAERAWGSYQMRLFDRALMFEPLLTPEALPVDLRQMFIPAAVDAVEPGTVALKAGAAASGRVWFRLNSTLQWANPLTGRYEDTNDNLLPSPVDGGRGGDRGKSGFLSLSSDLRLWIEVKQTPWDFRSLGSYGAVIGE